MYSSKVNLLKKFGKAVRSTRYSIGLSQMQLSEIIGCSLQTLGNIERGQANPSLIMVCRIAEALNVSTKDLVP